MPRTMYDSVTPAAIPAGADLVAGYGNGAYKWSPADWARFPHAAHVRIDVLGSDPEGCGVLDVEPGDATPQTAPAWVRKRQAHGFRAVIYTALANVAAVQAACHGISHIGYWVADWTGSPHHVDIPGLIAVQYRNTPGYDVSAVYDATWHRAS
jgi:hypothetical protein